MTNGVRLIIATNQQDLITCVRGTIGHKPYIDSIISVSRPMDAGNKLNLKNNNVLLWDLTTARHDISWVHSLRNTYKLHVIYTAFESAAPPILANNQMNSYLSKPAIFTSLTNQRYGTEIARILDGVASYRPLSMRDNVKAVGVHSRQKIVAIAASTGGTNALEEVIRGLPQDCPPILIVQHMPSGFTKLLADRLNSIYKQEIKEAETGDYLMQGRILLAPADKHMRLIRKQDKLAVECFVGNRIHGVMPAADILFESVAEIARSNAIGVVLTGMGNDGAKGLKLMHSSGSKNIGQNQASCVVYGMPKAAKDIGAIDFELPLFKIAGKILELV